MGIYDVINEQIQLYDERIRRYNMSERNITKPEQSCISACITKYWGNPHNQDDAEKRDRDYEQCLSDCRICG